MKKNSLIYLYGALIIFAGVFLLFSHSYSFNTVKITLGITLTIGAIFSFLTALSRKRKQVQFAYHEMHALAMVVYGVSVLAFCNSLETLMFFSSFLFLFYALSEIIFCHWLFNLGRKVLYKTVFVRFILGLLIGIGVVIIRYYPHLNKEIDLEGFGFLFIVVGVNILLYVPIMKKTELNGVSNWVS
jgi:uncharacterized membrane protein HdeD (DUF308 family)